MSAEQELANANVQIANLISEVTRFRDTAMGLNTIYPTVTEGRQAVADGKYFSVPGNGVYMRLYRRQGTTAELIAEYPTAEDVVLQSEIGTAASRDVTTSSTDTTVGRLTKVGDLGWHSNASFEVSDPDTTAYGGGFFQTLDTTKTPLVGSSGTLAYAHVPGTNANQTFHIGSYVAGGDGSGGRLFWRKRWQSNLSPWWAIYDNRSILGSVSQSGGVPTGAIIERGSNANGEYTKFADGTLICWRKNLITSDGALITWTYPAAASTTTGSLYVQKAGIAPIITERANSDVSTVLIGARDLSGSLVSVAVDVMLVSRWY